LPMIWFEGKFGSLSSFSGWVAMHEGLKTEEPWTGNCITWTLKKVKKAGGGKSLRNRNTFQRHGFRDIYREGKIGQEFTLMRKKS